MEIQSQMRFAYKTVLAEIKCSIGSYKVLNLWERKHRLERLITIQIGIGNAPMGEGYIYVILIFFFTMIT